MNWKTNAVALLGACLLGLGAWAAADETAQKGREVFAANKDAVITVRAVISSNMGRGEREDTNWANGTVIDPSGVTVLSLSFIDPVMVRKAMGQNTSEMTVKVVSMHLLRPDGEEVPAEVVLRDEDLDLVYVRPTAPLAQPMPCVNLEKIGAPQLLDTVAVIVQLGEVVRRAHAVLLAPVECVVEKPRTYYVLGEDRSRAVVSSPAFTLDGGLVGIGALRAVKGQSGAGGDNVLVVLVPAATFKEGLKQIPPMAAPAPKP